MKSHSIFSLKQKEKEKEMMQTGCPRKFSDHSLRAESIGLSSLTGNLLSDFQPNYLLEAYLFNLQKYFNQNFVSSSCIQNPSDTMFHTSLHSSPSYGTDQQLRDPPFLPYPSTWDQTTFAANPSHSDPLVLGGDAITKCDEEHPENLMDLIGIPEESSASKCQGSDCVEDGLSLTERLQLQQLSEELGVAFRYEDQNPRGFKISEAPQVSPAPIIELDCNRNNCSSVAGVNDKMHSNHQIPEAAGAQKQRISWTTELHELFIDAVNKLGGPEVATPKGILMLMDVDGLNIYNVKSHLQKYRLAKKVPELKPDKRASSSKEKVQASADNENDSHIKSDMQLETLRMQIELQKILHEQLKLQKEIQLRIEQQGEQLKKIMEEQEKAGSSLLPINGFLSLINSMSESKQPLTCPIAGTSANKGESNTDNSSSQPDKASLDKESEQSKSLKRPRPE